MAGGNEVRQRTPTRPGPRWWRPGVLVALVATAVTAVVAEGWSAYAAAYCSGSGWDSWCLWETVVGVLALVSVCPVLLFLGYRLAGVRRPLLSVPVAVAAGTTLLALPVLVVAVASLSGLAGPPLEGPGSSVTYAVVAGLGVLAGGLVWSGPHRAARAGAAGLALAALAGSALLVGAAADAARDARTVSGAGTPLVLAPGWRWVGPYSGAEGRLGYEVRLDGAEDPFDRVKVEVTDDPAALERRGRRCQWDPCRRVGEVGVVGPTDGTGTVKAWRVLDGHLVEVTAYRQQDPDPVAFLTAARVVGTEDFLAARVDR